MSGSFFIYFIMSGLASFAVILLILLVKKVFKKHVSPRWQYNIDFLFLILLAVPFIPSGFLSFSGMESWLDAVRFGENAAANVNVAAREGTGMMSGSSWLNDFVVSVNRSAPEHLLTVFIGIWLAGMIAFAIFIMIYNKNLRLIKESMKPVQNPDILSLFELCKTELGIKSKNIRIGTSILVKTPIAFGVIKTSIILPAEKMTANDVRYALLHELSHYKNRDIPVNSIMCLFQIIYWFNPLVFIIFKKMRLDREIACDTSVLKHLPKERYIDYGETLLNFVAAISHSTALTFATDIGGNESQIIKRIKHIASYKKESRLLKAKSICVFTIAGLFILSQIPAISTLAAYDEDQYCFNADNIEYEDLSSFFDGFDGSFVLYDLETELYTIHNKEKSVTRVSPASTYKIFSGLIALETGVLDIESSKLNWDGTLYPYEAWNQDQDLMSAMKDSVTWYFQEIDAQVGIKKLDSYFTQISYGNHDLSGGIATYWVESSLRISPIEQVELLKNFYQNNTLFQNENVDMMKEILRLSEKDGSVLSGKTGTGSVNGKVTNGWFVGYVENNGHVVIFATNIQGEDGALGSVAAQITLSILEAKGIY